MVKTEILKDPDLKEDFDLRLEHLSQTKSKGSLRQIYVTVHVLRPCVEAVVRGSYRDHPDGQRIHYGSNKVDLHFVDFGEGGTAQICVSAWKFSSDGQRRTHWSEILEIEIPKGQTVDAPLKRELVVR